YTKATDKRILRLLDKPAPEGFARWTGALLAETLGDVDVQYVWRFLRNHKIDLMARKSWCESNDPNFTAKAADVVGPLRLPRFTGGTTSALVAFPSGTRCSRRARGIAGSCWSCTGVRGRASRGTAHSGWHHGGGGPAACRRCLSQRARGHRVLGGAERCTAASQSTCRASLL